MNKELQEFARNYIKEGLSKLPNTSTKLFKRMYSFKNLDADINKVIDDMPEKTLDWAMKQVEQTIKKFEPKQL